ncbi:hypothetical protein YC2023_077317 [Brassica napus]|uniref:(rape) hypothetical protein n=1 Tax=Brassica napus TaxID=3708 RepID=A0A816QAI4_BRANA|nr:unnamed protein product [Brassica napus]
MASSTTSRLGDFFLSNIVVLKSFFDFLNQKPELREEIKLKDQNFVIGITERTFSFLAGQIWKIPLHRTSWSSSVIADEFERKPSRFVFSFAAKSSFLLHVVLSATHLRCTLTVARGGRDARTQLRWSSLQ